MRFDFPPLPPWPVKRRPPSRRRWRDCRDCGIDTWAISHFYMVRDDVWLAAVPDGHGCLCLDCLQVRLGRPLVVDHFEIIPAEMLERLCCAGRSVDPIVAFNASMMSSARDDWETPQSL